jgi:hypothetical protein
MSVPCNSTILSSSHAKTAYGDHSASLPYLTHLSACFGYPSGLNIVKSLARANTICVIVVVRSWFRWEECEPAKSVSCEGATPNERAMLLFPL